ncbi:BlaI/MecI/CopY family transcriptional regulator [Streptomyces sp. NPDC005921]|uniref:BlaI/MecI/CopY family transcriptional regulator n=1 Tax=Streptomyces sp. NPDC005827 TaxID=3157070 RepID=UPI0033DEF466
MPDNTTHTTELASHYISQVNSDLDHNRKEQERITAELAALQEQLNILQQDHTVLVTMQQALGVPATPVQPASTESATLPPPRKKPASASGTRRPAKKAAAPQPQDEEASQPTLVDLIHQHVSNQNEPRSAAEIAEALRQAHPQRTIDTKVVRTTLENLVAKNRVRRNRQNSSVFYTPTSTAQQEAASTDEPQPEPAQ